MTFRPASDHWVRFLCIGVSAVALSFAAFGPKAEFEPGTYALDGAKPRVYAGNLLLAHSGSATVSFSLSVPAVRPSYYRVDGDDCVSALSVNGRALPVAEGCVDGRALDLSRHLRTGTNAIKATVRNADGDLGFHMAVSRIDPLSVGLAALAAAALLLLVSCAVPVGGAGWAKTERLMLCWFLALRAMLFVLQRGNEIGFDAGPHLEYMRRLAWDDPLLPVLATLYSYHPPLGFLLPRLAEPFGLTGAGAVHATSAAFSLAAFFALRATLSRLGVLKAPAGIAFLYLASSLPIAVFLARSVNIDVQVLAYAAIVLYLSVRAFWTDAPTRTKFVLLAACGAALGCAMLTKASGLLLFALPAIVLGTRAARASRTAIAREWKGWLAAACLVGAVSGAVFLPYYVARYYGQKGVIVFLDGMPVDHERQEEARLRRDLDPVTFVAKMFLPTPAHRDDLTARDTDAPRLADTWKDVWLKDQWLGRSSFAQRAVGTFYWTVAPLFLLAGAWVFARRFRAGDAWSDLGLVFGAFGAVQLAALVAFVYRMPWGPAIPSKAIYVAPAAWCVAFGAASALSATDFLAKGHRDAAAKACLAAVALFMAINHLLPAY